MKFSKKYKWILALALCMPIFLITGCTRSIPSSAPPASPSKSLYPKPYKVMGQWYQPLPDARGFRQTGIASWYGQDFHGKKTSNGEVYDMYAESAAHKTLPLGTIVNVRNLDNGREMRIRINDRGPFVSGRIIDLSYASAQKLGVVQRGTARVEIEAVGTTAPALPDLSPDYYYSGNFTIQIGAFANRDNAEKVKQNLIRTYQPVEIIAHTDSGQTFYRVRVARCTSLEQAEQVESRLRQAGFSEAFAVAE
ncbi:MAG: septal ring lytic transglycosylase RlpA family protein [Desulfatirhabdiaceae bacterium]